MTSLFVAVDVCVERVLRCHKRSNSGRKSPLKVSRAAEEVRSESRRSDRVEPRTVLESRTAARDPTLVKSRGTTVGNAIRTPIHLGRR